MPCLPVASTSSLPGSLLHSDTVNKSHIGFQMLSSSFAILCLPLYTVLRDTRMCPGPSETPGHLDTMQVTKGEACSLHTRQAASLPSTSLFHLPLQSLGRARSTESTQPAGPSPDEQFGQLFQHKGRQTSLVLD